MPFSCYFYSILDSVMRKLNFWFQNNNTKKKSFLENSQWYNYVTTN